MKPILTLIAALLLLSTKPVVAQKKPALLSFNVSYSDYNTPALIRDSSISTALKRGDWYRPSKNSFGFGVGWWKGLSPKLDFSGNLTGTFSNFPELFVKSDSVGQAGFSPQLDALLHLKAFTDEAAVNPFLTAGVGAGLFRNQLAAYAPLGAGLQFQFREGAYLILQMQWRKRLTDGITQDYLHYTIGFTQSSERKRKEPQPKPKPETIAVAPAPPADRDGDGLPDNQDLCPTDKGSLKGCPDTDQDGVADKDDQCKDVAGLVRYKGCPVPDRDGDGINDEEDACPDSTGAAKDKGCPEIKQEIKKVVDMAARSIQFKFASDELLESSLKSLYEVASILIENPKLNLRIEAHADNRGLPERNMMWSEKRAKAVADYFTSKGIKADRISFKGYGDTQPVADNKTEAGRAKNRRVEMLLSY